MHNRSHHRGQNIFLLIIFQNHSAQHPFFHPSFYLSAAYKVHIYLFVPGQECKSKLCSVHLLTSKPGKCFKDIILSFHACFASDPSMSKVEWTAAKIFFFLPTNSLVTLIIDRCCCDFFFSLFSPKYTPKEDITNMLPTWPDVISKSAHSN